MQVHGLQKLTLLDYPGKTACTLFTHGCNFRCPYCHNAPLVIAEKGPAIPEQQVMDFLKKRSSVLEGVCISGGEPTLRPDLVQCIQTLKSMGYMVKLDTNGSKPDVLAHLLEHALVDYVAMDIKASLPNYQKAAGTKVNQDDILRSVQLLTEGSIDYEFRTTLVHELHSMDDIHAIGIWLHDTPRYALQTFKDSGTLLEQNYSAWTVNEMNHARDILAGSMKEVFIR